MVVKQLAEVLLENGLVNEAQLAAAYDEHQRGGRSLGRILVEHGVLNEAQLVQALAHQIVDWNWTDDFDKPLPSPANGKEAFTEALRWLSPKERVWLEEHVMDGALPSKNSESP